MRTPSHAHTRPHVHCLTYAAFFSPSSHLMTSSLSIVFPRYVYFHQVFSSWKKHWAISSYLHSTPQKAGQLGGGSVCPESRDRRNVDLVPAALAPLFLPPFPAPGSWACLTPVPASGSSPGNRASRAVTSPAWGLMGICASEMAFSGCCWPVGSQLILEFFFLI